MESLLLVEVVGQAVGMQRNPNDFVLGYLVHFVVQGKRSSSLNPHPAHSGCCMTRFRLPLQSDLNLYNSNHCGWLTRELPLHRKPKSDPQQTATKNMHAAKLQTSSSFSATSRHVACAVRTTSSSQRRCSSLRVQAAGTQVMQLHNDNCVQRP